MNQDTARRRLDFGCRLLYPQFVMVRAAGVLFSLVLAMTAGSSAHSSPQAGRKSPSDAAGGLATLNVIVDSGSLESAARPGPAGDRLAPENLEIYDAGILQHIEYFRPDFSPARIVILVDRSESLRATEEQRRDVIQGLADQLYQGDQAMVVAYDQHPDVIEEFTGDKPKLKMSAEKLGKGTGTGTGTRLLDAIQATLNDALRLEIGISKRVIVVISDGYDSDSETPFQTVLRNLQRDNILVYAVKFDDRTRGASRRHALKPEEMLTRLTAGTGGRIVEGKQFSASARGLLREISDGWFQLSYRPQGINPLIARRLLLIPNDRRLKVRTKSEQPPERL